MKPHEFYKLTIQEQGDVWPTLSPSDQSMIRSARPAQRYAALLNQKSDKQRLVYIILALVLGGLGVHNFYAGRSVAGILQLVLFLLSILSFFLGFGIFILALVYILVIVEICTVTQDGEDLKMT